MDLISARDQHLITGHASSGLNCLPWLLERLGVETTENSERWLGVCTIVFEDSGASTQVLCVYV